MLGQSRWADLRKVKGEPEPPDRGAHMRGEHATETVGGVSSAFSGRTPLAAAKPGEDALAIVVDGQTHRGDDRDERDGIDVLLFADVRAEVRRDPRPRQPTDGRHEREHPEPHRAHAEEIRDDVLREAGNQIEDETDDGALGLDDEVHLLPVVLGEPRPDQRLAPQPPERKADERAEGQPDRRIDHAPQRAEQRAAHRSGDLAGNRRDDDLQRLNRDEHQRRPHAPRAHGLFEEMLVLVEPNEIANDRSIGDDEPDHDDETDREGNRRDRPPLRVAPRGGAALGSRPGHRAGLCALHGRAASNAAAAASTARSAWRRPTICSPTGSPSVVSPAGTDAAGWPVRLNGYVNGIQPSTDTASPSISRGGRPSAANGATAVVGVRSKSKRSENARTSSQYSATRARARR